MTKEEYISAQTESYQRKYKTLFKRVAEYEKKIEQVRKTEHRAEKTPSLVEPHVPVVSEN